MSTEPTSLESMLDNEPNEQASPAPQVETGVTSTAPPADAPVQQTRDDDGPLVPRKALEDERRKRQDIERQLQAIGQQRQQPQQQQQFEIPQEAPDPFIDPTGYAQWVSAQAVTQANQRAEFMMLNREVNRSERRARKAHGDDVVEKAVEAAQRAGVAIKFVQEDDPYDELVKWYSDYQVATDPASHRERIKAEIMAEMGISPQQGQQPQRQRAPVPKSLASTASAQPRNDRGQFQGPRPLEDILG